MDARVLERSRRIVPLVLQLEFVQSAIFCATCGIVNLRISLTEGHNLNFIVKRQKFPKAPHSASISNVIRHSPLAPRPTHIRRFNHALSCSLNLEQITTPRTYLHPLVEFKNTSTCDVDTPLNKLVHNNGNISTSYFESIQLENELRKVKECEAPFKGY